MWSASCLHLMYVSAEVSAIRITLDIIREYLRNLKRAGCKDSLIFTETISSAHLVEFNTIAKVKRA